MLSRTSLPDQVFHRLVSDVLSGRFAVGERLPTQRALAAELGVNMASVREGVKRLEQLGLVEVRQGDAMRVTDWRTSGGLDVIAHVLFDAGGLDRDTLSHLMESGSNNTKSSPISIAYDDTSSGHHSSSFQPGCGDCPCQTPGRSSCMGAMLRLRA